MKRTALHGLAAVALIAATLAIWHWRFVAVPDALPPIHLSNPIVGWTSQPHEKHEVVITDGQPVLRLERKSTKDKSPAVGIWFGQLEGVRFIRIRCESHRQNVELGRYSWSLARFVVFMEDHNGRKLHPPDSVIFHGSGSSPWEQDEVILELTGDMAGSGLHIAMLGKTGVLEVRELSVVAVRQRSWVPAATVAIVLGWLVFCTSLVRGTSGKPARWRAFAAAAIVIAVSWITIFPQTKGLLRSSVGGFAVNEPPAPTAPVVAPKPPASNPAPAPKPPAITNPSPPQATPKPPAAANPTPEPAHRQSGSTHKLIRESDKNFRLVHFGFYTGFTFVILLITGQARQWTLPLAVAFLSELVPALLDHIGDWADWTDLLQNSAGVALAVVLWHLWQRILAKRAKRKAAVGT